MSRGRFSWLVEQVFEEVDLVCLGQGCCMLQVFVGAVYERSAVFATAVRCMCAAVVLGSSAWVRSKV